ncbi:hypothetical protein GBA52_004310 [Prunus armeniaca]|nr:hypothetical protein GBA52_004310 [Prunus armeniaca]
MTTSLRLPLELRKVRSKQKKVHLQSRKRSRRAKFLKYCKSTNVAPSSNDEQEIWSTLVHNGVIFTPPYKPDGVKMLYNGEPVNLTPQQEEEIKTLCAFPIKVLENS